MPQAGTLLELADFRRLRRGKTAPAPEAPAGSDPAPGSQLAVGFNRSAVGRVQAEEVQVATSAAAVVTGHTVTVERSGAAVLAGTRLHVNQGAGQWLIGGLVQAKQVFAVTVIAGKIEGDVRCLFDTKGAIAFGAALAVAGGVMRLLFGRR